MSAKIRELIGFPLEGSIGLNHQLIEVYEDTVSGMYHVPQEEPCRGKPYPLPLPKSHPSALQVPLGDALGNMCEDCLDLEVLYCYASLKFGDNIFVPLPVDCLLNFLYGWDAVYPTNFGIDSMDALEVHATVTRILQPLHEGDFRDGPGARLDVGTVLCYLPWVQDREITFSAEIAQLRERLSKVDNAPLKRFYARSALDSKVPHFLSRPDMVESFNDFVEGLVKQYAEDETVHLVVANYLCEYEIPQVLSQLYGYKDTDLLLLSTAALDYLVYQAADNVIEHVEVKRGVPEEILEAVSVLYDPYDTDSPLSSLTGAYAAALKV